MKNLVTVFGLMFFSLTTSFPAFAAPPDLTKTEVRQLVDQLMSEVGIKRDAKFPETDLLLRSLLIDAAYSDKDAPQGAKYYSQAYVEYYRTFILIVDNSKSSQLEKNREQLSAALISLIKDHPVTGPEVERAKSID